MSQALILPMAAHVALTAFLYVLLTVARVPAQTLTRNVRLRGIVFTLNFLAGLALWVLVVWPAGTSPAA